jgi:hypothetical protein
MNDDSHDEVTSNIGVKQGWIYLNEKPMTTHHIKEIICLKKHIMISRRLFLLKSGHAIDIGRWTCDGWSNEGPYHYVNHDIFTHVFCGPQICFDI